MFRHSQLLFLKQGIIGLFIFSAAIIPAPGNTARCLFVSSYHKGYAWSDGVENGLRKVLDSKCELRQFDMDTKRHKDETSKRNAAEKARQLIYDWKPDVVIAADDNAAKYLIKPFFRNHAIPFVFCGINWSVEEYGLPYPNVTGMIEVAPIKPMLERAQRILPRLNKAYYIGAKTLTEEKNLSKINKFTEKMGIDLSYQLVENTAEWLSAYANAQGSDLIIIGSSAGMERWGVQAAKTGIVEQSSKLSVTNHGWMMPVTMLGFTKVPEEHGEWAGKVALSILAGKDPQRIPIIANRKWDLWANQRLLNAAGIKLPRQLIKKAKKVSD